MPGARVSSGGINPFPQPIESAISTTDSPTAFSFSSLIDKYRLWLLLLITILGGAARFTFLSKPTLWGDEAFTFSRVCGDYRQMLDVLAFDGFPPLHYQLYWLIGRCTPLTPIAMRIVPSVFGTLMIPAVYFVAVQILNRRIALLSALFTACSAYMMVYSRDAKMYMACWFFATLNIGCFLYWLKHSQRWAFLAWIASGLAMAGMQLTGLTIFAIEPIIFLTSWSRRGSVDSTSNFTTVKKFAWKKLLLFPIGLLIIGSGPAGYKLGFNRWTDHIEEVGFASGSGIAWVDAYNKERNGSDLTLFATTAHLFSWEWPTLAEQNQTPGISRYVMHMLMAVGTILLLLLAYGTLNIHKKSKSPVHQTDHSMPENVRLFNWKALLWLSAWIVIPCYATYCLSMREFSSPLDWLQTIGDLFEGYRIIIAIVSFITIVSLLNFAPRLATVIYYLLPIALLIATGCLFTRYRLDHRTVTRLQDSVFPAAQWAFDHLCHRYVLRTLLVLLPALAFTLSGTNLKSRLTQSAVFLSVCVALFLICIGIWLGISMRFNDKAATIWMDHHDAPQWEMYKQSAIADHDVPGKDKARKKVIADMRLNSQEVDPQKHPLNDHWIEKRASRLIEQKKQRWNEHYQYLQKHNPRMMEPELSKITAERIASERVAWDKWLSVWMPRYIGVCWPAVAIAAIALLMRLPSIPLRTAAIVALLALNTTQAVNRILLVTEPRFDLMFADVVASQYKWKDVETHSPGRVLFWNMTPFNIGHPGSLGLSGMAGRYYLTQAAGIAIQPSEFRNFRSAPRSGVPWKPYNVVLYLDESPRNVIRKMESDTTFKNITELIIWERTDQIKGEAYSTQLLKQLGENWTEKSDQIFIGYYHWNWSQLHTVHRRVLMKKSNS